MLEKEWIANDKGQIVAIWVQRDRASQANGDYLGVTRANPTESLELPSDPFKNNSRIHGAFQELQSLRVTARQLAPARSSKSGNWARFYTILKSVLP
jgi:hypothetical protein